MGGWHIRLQLARSTWCPARPAPPGQPSPGGAGSAGSARRLRARSRPSARPLRRPLSACDPAGTGTHGPQSAHGKAGAPRSGSAPGIAAPGPPPAAESLPRFSREDRTAAPGTSLQGKPVEKNSLSFKVSAFRSPGKARPQTRHHRSAFSPAERCRGCPRPPVLQPQEWQQLCLILRKKICYKEKNF